MNQEQTSTFVGLDNGYANVKVCANAGKKEFTIPSVAIKVDDLTGPKGSMPEVFKDSSGDWLVGDGALRMADGIRPNVDSTKYQSDQYRVHALYALSKLGYGDITIATGVSVQFYRKNREEIVRTMMGWSGKVNGMKIRRVIVLPEPLGTYMDEMLDFNGVNRNAIDQAHCGIIDVGGNTVDLLEVIQGEISPQRKGLSEGMFRAYHDLYTALMSNKKIEPALSSMYDMRKVFETGHILVNGEKIDLTKQVKEARSKFARSIIAIIKERSTGWRTAKMERIYLTGGAAPFVYEELKEEIPHLKMSDNPVMANARGFYKLLVQESRC